MNLGGAELLILVAVIVLVFGAGWLPKAARNLGKAKVELDKAQQQFTDTKQQVVEATGIQELDATLKKANKALKTTPQGLLKDAASSAMKPPVKPVADDGIEDAEIVDQPATAPKADTNLNVDFSD